MPKKDTNRNIADSAPVLMTTVMIPKGATYVYEITNCNKDVTLGCVAETNGLFSWKIETVETQTKARKPYRDNKNEKTGRGARRMDIRCNKPYKIILTITNTGNTDSSFAIIAG